MKINNHNVTVIGITGTIGAGKSTVGKILAELGVPVIDTDKITHALLAGDDQVKNLIKENFAAAVKTDVSQGDIQIDRKKLGAIIFKDAKAKAKLESILHPRVRQVCQQQVEEIAGARKPAIIAVLVPLLFENQLQSGYDQTWTVVTPDKILRKRLLQRDNFSAQEIDMRLAGQMSQDDKAKQADVVLDNSGSENELRARVQELIHNIM